MRRVSIILREGKICVKRNFKGYCLMDLEKLNVNIDLGRVGYIENLMIS